MKLEKKHWVIIGVIVAIIVIWYCFFRKKSESSYKSIKIKDINYSGRDWMNLRKAPSDSPCPNGPCTCLGSGGQSCQCCVGNPTNKPYIPH